MPFAPFIDHCRATALQETNTYTIPSGTPAGVPRETHILHELYCTELDCDCGLVRIVVMRGELGTGVAPEAVVDIGFEPPSFYRGKKLPIHAATGLWLPPGEPQGPWAEIHLIIIHPLSVSKTCQSEWRRHYKAFRATLVKNRN
jgi:hypothetical protein